MTELLFNKANDSVELRFVRGSSWGGDGSGAKESMPVTCDLFQLLSGAPYWNAVENFLRRGFIPLRAEPVAHLSLHSTDEDMSGAMIFSLTKSKQSRAPVLDALASFAAPCAGSTASRPSFPCLRLFRGLVEEHLAGLPVILETPVRTDADRLVASHVTSMMSVLLRGARDVLTTHLEHLADEHVTDRLQEDRSPKAVSPEVSLNLDERELL
jgi:hypothetical protein